MTLVELVYQIDGELERKFNPDNTCKVRLLDNTNSPAMVLRTIGPTNEWHREEVEASTTGRTPEEAEDNLVKLLSGNILQHNWPVMWTTSKAILRIPETLVVSNYGNFPSADYS